jgi:transposase
VTFLEAQVKRLDSTIADQLTCIPHTLETIPGIGPVFAGGIVAEVGDIARFEYDQAKVAKFAGFKWKKHQSGDFTAEETRMTRTGNRYLRYYLRRPTRCGCMTASMVPTMNENIAKCGSTNTNVRLC